MEKDGTMYIDLMELMKCYIARTSTASNSSKADRSALITMSRSVQTKDSPISTSVICVCGPVKNGVQSLFIIKEVVDQNAKHLGVSSTVLTAHSRMLMDVKLATACLCHTRHPFRKNVT